LYHQKYGTPLRSQLFANIALLSQLATMLPPLAPLANWSMTLPPAKWAMGKLGIAPQRSLPPFTPKTFHSWFIRENPQSPNPNSKQVVLFVDTFMNYNYPSIGIAATQVLRAAGCEVLAPQRPCCGRPYISKGLLEKAHELAKQNVALLAPYAQQGVPIVGTEPSCLLTLRDEYLDFLPNDEDAKLVASKAMLLEEFLTSSSSRLQFNDMKKNVLIHGHCHQKSALGMGPVMSALTLNPAFTVSESGAGCCGMAGSFGFEREHYELSMKVGEDRLFPKVRAQSPDTEIAVSGVSCRQQIEHGTGRKARHWVEVMADNLKNDLT
jgi:Fe-S oxidoreductase